MEKEGFGKLTDNSKLFQLSIPTKLYFGRNIWREALKLQENFLTGNVMVVTTGRSLVRLGYLGELKKQMETSRSVKKICIFDHISADPRLEEVREGICFGRQEKADVIVGFGGGSALDAAKAVAAGMGIQEDIGEYLHNGGIPGRNTLPIMAIPTTAGTGSELSRAAVITDEFSKVKKSIRSENIFPAVAIVDSMFTESAPLKVTMETGFDVLAHAVESYVSKASSAYTKMLSEYAVRIVGKYLPRLKADLKDIEARGKMSYASMIMGINLGNASTCLPHRLQYPMGVRTDTSHGAGLAALFSAWVDLEYPYAFENVERMMSLLAGEIVCGREACVDSILRFIRMLGLPASLKELGADRQLINTMALAVTGNTGNDPASQDADIIMKLYEKAWEVK